MRLREPLILIVVAACGGAAGAPDATPIGSTIDATPIGSTIDATPIAAIDSAAPAVDAGPGFGDLSGMCGVLTVGDLTGASPEIIRARMSFPRAFVHPDDDALLTPGGQRMINTPNAGGNSLLSEVFALEQLTRCEGATLLKTETEIVYDTTGKITDFESAIDGHKIGVSVTRAETYPLGQTYTLEAATTLITRKLDDIQTSTADVSAGDRWDKQILAILAYDDQAADAMAQAWTNADAQTKADTIVLITTTDGDDTFIYTNM
jgi:hypothetical protein